MSLVLVWFRLGLNLWGSTIKCFSSSQTMCTNSTPNPALCFTLMATPGTPPLECWSSTNIKQHFDECFDYIEEAKRSGGSVLVHCFVGRSRSVAIAVAYLLKKHGMTIFQALDHVKSR
ncbi:hypothetical protein ABKV19_023256 [Rosa sericea]